MSARSAPSACERFILWLDGILWPQEWPRSLRMALTGAVLGTVATGCAALLMFAWALIAPGGDRMTDPRAGGRGFLVTFKPCGHVQHYNGEPRPGTWASCNYMPHRKGCQAQRQVQAVEQCPGCPECPGWKAADAWRQPSLFDDQGRAA